MKATSIFIILFLVTNIIEAKQIGNRDKIEISMNHSNIQNGSSDRHQSISADITGHTLTITFNDNVGIAHIVIKDSSGVYIDRENVFSTPDYSTLFRSCY